MTTRNPEKADIAFADRFPVPPVEPTSLLIPISSWNQMYSETQATGVEFDGLWHDCAMKGVACFFSWHGEPRATVLVVYDGYKIIHVECRKVGDLKVSEEEEHRIVGAVKAAFSAARLATSEGGVAH